MDPIRVYIWMYLSGLISEGNVTIEDVSLNFSDNVLGTLDLTNILITGVETLTNDINNINTTVEDDGNTNLCLRLPIGNLQLTMNYVADIGVDNEIPIYGDGLFSFTMTDIEMNVCMFVNFNEVYLDDVVFLIKYRHQPIEFTGFWKNREVSLILQNLMNIANRFFAMWSMYEPERASCLTSPFVSYLLNKWFGNENATLVFDRSCLEGIFFDDKATDIYNIEEHILKKMLATHTDSTDSLNIFAEENKPNILPIIKHVMKLASRLF